MNNQPPKTWQEEQEEIDEWVEERREDAQGDYDELIRDLEELDYERTIADFRQGAVLP